ncbi:MAG: protease modulator HflK [Planctomycetota bacterium]|jgi:membrane protease subunit HflK
MTDQINNDSKVSPPPLPGEPAGVELDPASKFLSEALRVSFVILKVIIIVLVIAFLASGIRTVGSDEKALVLRFGKIRGVGEQRILGPGLKLLFPYPIHEVVKIPVEKKVNLAIDSFWYFQTRQELLGEKRTRPPEKLNPTIDGYCITRSEKQDLPATGSESSDYHLVHCKWQITYQIDDPERFFKNVYVEDIKPGQVYFDTITRTITPLLESLVEDVVVTAMVNYTIDEVMFEKVATVTDHVKKLLQEKLNEIESGITVVSIQLTDRTWPRQVHPAFLASINASQDRQRMVSEARTDAEKTLNEAAGAVSEELFEVLEGKTVSEEQEKLLWDNLAGRAWEKISEARAYRTRVVETAKASADYLQELLPEYRKRPRLILQEIYWDAIEYVLRNAGEKFIIQPADEAKRHEIRVILNRDQTIKRKSRK